MAFQQNAHGLMSFLARERLASGNVVEIRQK
jgi:hypothetical protein